ncbi:hypothetical protein ACS3SW_20615 [Roseobacteraceae bacterium S113]
MKAVFFDRSFIVPGNHLTKYALVCSLLPSLAMAEGIEIIMNEPTFRTIVPLPETMGGAEGLALDVTRSLNGELTDVDVWKPTNQEFAKTLIVCIPGKGCVPASGGGGTLSTNRDYLFLHVLEAFDAQEEGEVAFAITDSASGVAETFELPAFTLDALGKPQLALE